MVQKLFWRVGKLFWHVVQKLFCRVEKLFWEVQIGAKIILASEKIILGGAKIILAGGKIIFAVCYVAIIFKPDLWLLKVNGVWNFEFVLKIMRCHKKKTRLQYCDSGQIVESAWSQ